MGGKKKMLKGLLVLVVMSWLEWGPEALEVCIAKTISIIRVEQSHFDWPVQLHDHKHWSSVGPHLVEPLRMYGAVVCKLLPVLASCRGEWHSWGKPTPVCSTCHQHYSTHSRYSKHVSGIHTKKWSTRNPPRRTIRKLPPSLNSRNLVK